MGNSTSAVNSATAQAMPLQPGQRETPPINHFTHARDNVTQYTHDSTFANTRCTRAANARYAPVPRLKSAGLTSTLARELRTSGGGISPFHMPRNSPRHYRPSTAAPLDRRQKRAVVEHALQRELRQALTHRTEVCSVYDRCHPVIETHFLKLVQKYGGHPSMLKSRTVVDAPHRTGVIGGLYWDKTSPCGKRP